VNVVTPDFLVRFMVAYDFPQEWPNQGYKAFSTNEFHFMYGAWKTYKRDVDDSDSEPECEYEEPSYSYDDDDY
jgi:hypothetical protein